MFLSLARAVREVLPEFLCLVPWLRVGGGEIPENYVSKKGQILDEGYISLQSEGHPVEFREIKIKELK